MNELYSNQQTIQQTLIEPSKSARWQFRKAGVYRFILFLVDLLAVWAAQKGQEGQGFLRPSHLAGSP